MKSKLCLFEMLAAFILVLILIGTASAEKQSDRLARQLIRLHVVANSDSDIDQSIKLQVRDSVLKAMEGVLHPGMDRDEAARAILANSPRIQAAALSGSDGQPVTVRLTHEYYPTREYDNFSLPAGEYLSLQILLGQAEGRNWWCVVFPPLCTDACIEDVEDVWGLDEEEVALMTAKDGYVIRFRFIEWWEEMKEAFS